MKVQQKRRKQKTKTVAPAKQETPRADRLLAIQTLQWSLLSAVAVWLAFPPIGLWGLAWVAPFGWLRLINLPALGGKRPYRSISLIAYLHWLLMTYWVTLPHFAAAIGWLFLAAYLAAYLVGFIALARWLVHRAGWSSVIAAPIAWVSMEALRSYLFTGFALCSLSHSQVSFVPVMQVSKLTGAYGVSFLIMLVAAGVERAIYNFQVSRDDNETGGVLSSATPIGIPIAALLIILAYGFSAMRTAGEQAKPTSESAKVAIIQGSLDTEFDGDMSKLDKAFRQYINMTTKATRHEPIDLVVWPESMFRFDIVSYDAELKDQKMAPDFYTFGQWAEVSAVSTKREVSQFGTHCLLGTSTIHYRQDAVDRHNTAGFFDGSGRRLGSYHKMHPVMFGEYIPLGDVFPWIYSSGITPLRSGLIPGKQAEIFEAGGVSFVPNICFENTVPQLIRSQIRDLIQRDESPDAMVTLTNDGWFWGSALLDIHLACGIFRAVENDIPMLIAANTGFSAEIDRFGRVLQQGPRQGSKVLIANVQKADPDRLPSFYTRFGDVFAGANLLVALAGLGLGWRNRPTQASAAIQPSGDSIAEHSAGN